MTSQNQKHTPIFLMANLGSEVSKIFGAIERKDSNRVKTATSCANEIIAELQSNPELKSNMEVDLLSKIINDIGQTEHIYNITPKYLKSYFYPFAIKCLEENNIIQK